MQFKLLDANTKSALAIASSNANAIFSGGPIEPGNKISGTLFFAVSSSSSVDLQFNPDVTQPNYLSIQLPTINRI